MSVTVDDRPAQAVLKRLQEFTRKPGKATREVAGILETLVRETFRNQASPWGDAWADHAASTTKSRIRRGNFSTLKLIDTAELFDSIEARPTDDGITLHAGEGLPDPRAVANQFGTATLEARAFFPMRSPDNVDMPPAWWDRLLVPVQESLQSIADGRAP